MSQIIQQSEIQKGDTIRVEWPHYDADYACTGDATQFIGGDWYSEMNAQLTRTDRKQTIHLLNRPKPKLPAHLGALIIARIQEGTQEALIRRHPHLDGWDSLDGLRWYPDSEVSGHEWRLATVTLAETQP